ncbi:MAG: signal peptide peptidase SppA [Syntrophobacteraceae bacterium]
MKRRKTFFFGILLILLIIISSIWLVSSDSEIMAGPNRIGVIEIRGLISDSQETLKDIKKFRKDPNVKALIVRVDSPGGGIGPSQEIYRELRRTIRQKPVVASLGAIAASGGYYIASAAKHIVASPGSITGSIGVISNFPNLRELFSKVGFENIVIKSGQFKDVGNPGREMTPQERELLQTTIDEAHSQFILDVAEGRNMPEEKVREIADGRIIMGATAQKLGLIDELGNFEDALIVAAKLGKIEEEPVLVYPKKKKITLLDFLLGAERSGRLNSLLDSMDGSMAFLRYQLF